jgi:hypothetical protein
MFGAFANLALVSSLAGDPADAYFASGDFGRAAAAYAAELNENAANEHARLRLGEVRLYADDLDGAQEMLQGIPSGLPESSEAARQLAEIARRRGGRSAAGVARSHRRARGDIFTVDGGISHMFLKAYAYTVDFTAMKIVLQPEGSER